MPGHPPTDARAARSPLAFFLFLAALTLPLSSVHPQGEEASRADVTASPYEVLGNLYVPPKSNAGPAQKEIHVAPQGFLEPGISVPAAGITLPTSAGLIRLTSAPGGMPSPAGGPAQGGGRVSGAVQAARLPVLAAMLVAAAYLLISHRSRSGRAASSPRAPASDAPSWQTDYPIIRAIGRGGMGVVYEAMDRSLDRRVAIKRLREEIRDDPQVREGFLKEAKTVAALHHPAIVSIHAIIQQAGEIYLVFEFVEGRTVEAVLAQNGPIPLAQTRGILKSVCQALDFAHGRKVIHRDLKPSNVMVSRQGFVKVMDFGIARHVKDTVSKAGAPGGRYDTTNTVVGTPLYMAPEAGEGIVCPESDIYSLAAMAYEMLSGSPPFPEPASAGRRRSDDYPALSRTIPNLPAGLDDLLREALEPDPGRRVHSAAEFWKRMASV